LSRIEAAPNVQALAAIEDDLARQRTPFRHKILGALGGAARGARRMPMRLSRRSLITE
jgi:hypothetical protein